LPDSPASHSLSSVFTVHNTLPSAAISTASVTESATSVGLFSTAHDSIHIFAGRAEEPGLPLYLREPRQQIGYQQTQGTATSDDRDSGGDGWFLPFPISGVAPSDLVDRLTTSYNLGFSSEAVATSTSESPISDIGSGLMPPEVDHGNVNNRWIPQEMDDDYFDKEIDRLFPGTSTP
jgi:hypothetical protein